MKIALVIAPFEFNERFGMPFPIGVGYLATVLDKAGHQVKIIDCYTMKVSLNNLRSYLLTERPDLVGLNCTSYSRFSAIKIIKMAKQTLPNAYLVAGGPHFTATADDALKNVSEIDVIVRGEGERTILDLVRAIENGEGLKEIEGISFRNNGNIQHNRDRELIKDLDSLPILKRDFLENKFYLERLPHSNILCKSVVASRGCPFNCSFCFQHEKSYRRRTTDNILQEVSCLLEKYQIEAIRFFDLSFTVSRNSVEDFCNQIIRRKLKFKWYCESRVDIDLKLLELMKEAGCYSLDFGLESASPRVLKLINKAIIPEQALAFAKKCKELDIKTKAFFMISLPGEQKEDAEQTFNFAYQLSKYVNALGVSVTNIIPGSELEQRARQLNILASDFSWNSPIDYKKTTVFMKTEPVPLYIEKLKLSQIWHFYRKYSIFETFELKNLRISFLGKKAYNALTKWDKGIRFKVNWVFMFLKYGASRLLGRSRRQ
ncbi:MAG: radical SAM protein [Candidatus Omnitrophica bacterium]|nr:radical SAM protein [Candidatus Omnitrophota bacterium]